VHRVCAEGRNSTTMAGTMATIAAAGLIRPASTVFFLCDIQERFAGLISYWPSVVAVAQRMVRGVAGTERGAARRP